MSTHFERIKMGGSRGMSKAEMEILNSFHLEDTDMSWQDDAYCRDSGIDFFPENSFNTKAIPAIAMCEACPVKDRCLEFAMNNNINWGIWGGKTAPNRRSIKRQRYPRYGNDIRPSSNSVLP
jgi:WhiB family transcriptional regulator, redox-sensing transcriptional regulator